MIDQQDPLKMETKLHKIGQRWLDEESRFPMPDDLEPELNKLADDAGQLAECEHKLIESIQAKKRNLERLPEIIQGLERQLNSVSQELGDVLYRYDELCKQRGLLLSRQLRRHNQQQPAEVEA